MQATSGLMFGLGGDVGFVEAHNSVGAGSNSLVNETEPGLGVLVLGPGHGHVLDTFGEVTTGRRSPSCRRRRPCQRKNRRDLPRCRRDRPCHHRRMGCRWMREWRMKQQPEEEAMATEDVGTALV